MDGRQFDAWTKRLATAGVSRRGLMKALAGSVLGGTLGWSRHDQARAVLCRAGGYLCTLDAQCCSGACDPTTHQCTCTDLTQKLCRDRCADCCGDTDCANGQICQQGTCITACTLGCTGKVCGDDGCGGSCGSCSGGLVCQTDGSCACPSERPHLCGGSCTAFGTNANCGGCGDACTGNQHCV